MNKNERFNSVPIIVQQMATEAMNKSANQSLRFNNAQMLRTIRDYCEYALAEYEKTSNK